MMKFSASILSATLAGALLTGCASTPDPAKVCTSEWIAPRVDRAVSRIESKTSRSVKALSKASESWVKGKTPGPLTMLSLSSSLKSLEKELKDGRGMRDLKTLSSTCNDPKLVSTAMSNFMQKQGLPDNMIGFIESLPIYQDIIKAPLEKPLQG